jgi:hypothetical protein
MKKLFIVFVFLIFVYPIFSDGFLTVDTSLELIGESEFALSIDLGIKKTYGLFSFETNGGWYSEVLINSFDGYYPLLRTVYIKETFGLGPVHIFAMIFCDVTDGYLYRNRIGIQFKKNFKFEE